MEVVKEFVVMLTPLIAVIGAIFGIIQYFDNKNQEFKKRIWEERKLLYYEITDYASKISISNDIQKVKNEIEGFWSMYYGRLSIIEDAALYFSMINYGNELEKVTKNELIPCDSKLQSLSFKLAISCRTSLQDTWQPVRLEDLGRLDETQKS